MRWTRVVRVAVLAFLALPGVAPLAADASVSEAPAPSAATAPAATAPVTGASAPAPDGAPAPPVAAPPAPRLVETAHPLAGRVYSPAGRRFVPPERVEAAAARARFVLLGERHGNPVHHELQARLVAATANARRPAIVFEQLDFVRQPAIDDCAANCADLGTELGARVEWASTGWPAYALYRPVFATAARLRLPIRAGNPGAKRIRALGRGAEPEVGEEGWVRAATAPLQARGRTRLVDDLVDGHCGHLPRELVEPIVRAQRLRDAAFASTLMRAADEHGAAILVAGTGHVRRDYGVPTLLASRDVLVVGLVEAAAGRTRPRDYGPLDGYDFVWFTARVDEPDPCATSRPALEKLRAPPTT